MPPLFKKSTWAMLLPTTLLSLSCMARPQMDVSLAHGSAAEKRAQAQLAALMKKHDLSKWVQTRKVVIAAGEVPHSHPVLTINTRHLDRDDLALSTFVHEQIHWHIASKSAPLTAAIAELRALYPKLPVGYPKGASDELANYEHLVVIYLEDQANRELLGEQGALKVMQYWSGDHYTALVQIIMQDRARIAAIVKKHGLQI